MNRLPRLLLGAAALSAPASAATHIYMTGEQAPWGIAPDDSGSPEAALDLALGKGNWKSVFGFTTDIFKGAFSLIEGMEGSTLMGASFGEGYLMVGGMTAPFWQSSGGAMLRANIIDHAVSRQSLAAADAPVFAVAVPEPASWALMIASFGLIGIASRRKRRIQMSKSHS
jgi:hypothetical protein